jgi:hypothetical protein
MRTHRRLGVRPNPSDPLTRSAAVGLQAIGQFMAPQGLSARGAPGLILVILLFYMATVASSHGLGNGVSAAIVSPGCIGYAVKTILWQKRMRRFT